MEEARAHTPNRNRTIGKPNKMSVFQARAQAKRKRDLEEQFDRDIAAVDEYTVERDEHAIEKDAYAVLPRFGWFSYF